jgi:spore coat polysaccharide biosynthesis protein SpsF
MRTVAIIQARMGSTRLPGKVLMDLAGRTMLTRVVMRVRDAKDVDEVVVATTTKSDDDAIVLESSRMRAPVFRGSETDVLDRYCAAALTHRADSVVRITADCPLVDPQIIDEALATFRQGPFDYVGTGLEPRTFPRGLDVEVVSRECLERARSQDRDPTWREHVTPYIYRHPELFRVRRLSCEKDYSGYRWTVDSREDLELVRRIYEVFREGPFGWKDVIRLLETHPEWSEINRHVRQKELP